jgi:hypothetical protein
MASLASFILLTAKSPMPTGKCLLNPVSCSITGLPQARKAALLSLNQPVLFATNTFLHTLN